MSNPSATKLARLARRNVAIAGPVYADFSHICGALKLVREQVATAQIALWNKRNAPRARRALEQAANALCPVSD